MEEEEKEEEEEEEEKKKEGEEEEEEDKPSPQVEDSTEKRESREKAIGVTRKVSSDTKLYEKGKAQKDKKKRLLEKYGITSGGKKKC